MTVCALATDIVDTTASSQVRENMLTFARARVTREDTGSPGNRPRALGVGQTRADRVCNKMG
jgi:hypothetical protein